MTRINFYFDHGWSYTVLYSRFKTTHIPPSNKQTSGWYLESIFTNSSTSQIRITDLRMWSWEIVLHSTIYIMKHALAWSPWHETSAVASASAWLDVFSVHNTTGVIVAMVSGCMLAFFNLISNILVNFSITEQKPSTSALCWYTIYMATAQL